jgi:ferritin
MIAQALNDQIAAELFSANLYLSFYAHFASESYDGMGAYMLSKYNEESEHANVFIDYMISRQMEVTLQSIDAPERKNFLSCKELFILAFEHEKRITARINKLLQIAMDENDFATVSFLKKFVDEQVEEEDEAFSYVQKLIRIDDDVGALDFFDHELFEEYSKKSNG